VAIMKEAVEICKLRLFLKLVSQVRRADQLEPLPDIDFNIRAGNTLVGFVSLDDVRHSGEGKLVLDPATVERIVAAAEDAAEKFRIFHKLQTEVGADAIDFRDSKPGLLGRLAKMRDQLDRHLAGEYDVDPDDPARFDAWRASHLPFHWFTEFYGIICRGGFDVVIGNPPWKEYAAVKKEYTVRGFVTEKCGNLHTLCTERVLRLRSSCGRMSFIVQLPLTCSSRMKPARQLLRSKSGSLHVLSFDDRPGKLFNGMQHCRSAIFLSRAPGNEPQRALSTTRYHRWLTEARESLFDTLEFAHIVREPIYPDHFPKSVSDLQESVFTKVRRASEYQIGDWQAQHQTSDLIFYQEATGYWIKATLGLPYYAKNGVEGAPAHGRFIYFPTAILAQTVCAVLNSSLFYAYFITHGDCFHLSDTLVTGFPINSEVLDDGALVILSARLMQDLTKKAELKTIRTKGGDAISYAEFSVSLSKTIIDKIDRILAEHYGFTDEELDFILNYDIKYRMGQDAAGEEDDE
jgi:hypothetical protein